MAKASANAKPFPLPWPFQGIDENFSFSDQRPGTTPDCLNVRPYNAVNGRRQGSRRPGMSKHIPGQVADGPVQCIDVAVLPRGAAAGTGEVFTTGTGTDKVLTYPHLPTSATATFVSASLSGSSTIGKADEDNNFYVASDVTGTVQVSRLPTNHNTSTAFGAYSASNGAWQNTTLQPGATYRLCGLAVNGGVVYVYFAGTAVSAIYRLNAVTGALMDSGAWMTHNDSLPVVSLGNGSLNMLGIGSGLLGVLGTVGANTLAIVAVDIATKAIQYTSALSVGYGPFNGHLQELNICADLGANFYVAVLTSDDGVTNFHSRLHRVHWDGTLVTKTDSASPAGTVKGIYDVTFNPAGNNGNGLLGVVGNAINGTTNSFQLLTPETLVTVSGYKPANWSTINRVASDGLGYYAVRRVGNPDLLKTTGVTGGDFASWNSGGGAGTGEYSGVATEGFLASTNVAPAAVSTAGTLRLLREQVIVNGGLYRIDSGYSDLVKSGFCSGASAATSFQPATVVFSTNIGFNVVYVDGFNYPVYNFSTNLCTTLDALAAAGSASASFSTSAIIDTNGRRCRLCDTWRGRLVLAGMLSAPDKWFMSKVGDITNWNYAPATPSTPSTIDAVSSTNALALQVGDVINGIVPCGDNILLWLCEHSVWRLTGDPLDGGVSSQVSDITGGAFGRAWCQDPAGNVYFYGSNGSVWQMPPTGSPQRLSLAIDAPRLFTVDLSKHIISMVWDDRWKGVRIFISPYDETEDTIHYYWDSDTKVRLTIEVVKTPGSWWPDQFANKNHNPLCVYALDADAAEQRVILLGTRDGYILREDVNAKSDDGTAIESYVYFGPIKDNGFTLLLSDLLVVLDGSSANVSYQIQCGESAQEAYEANSSFDGTFYAGPNHSPGVRLAEHAMFVKFFASQKAGIWSIDSCLAVVTPQRTLASLRF
jgi:hypothetical protein